MATASVIVPAHDEQALIGRTLDTLLADAADGEFDVVVVCNGCSDDTAEIARRRTGVRVLEIDQASKIAALNAGDEATDVMPRIYLDADVSVTTASLRAVIAAMNDGAPAAAPLPVIDTEGRSALIRAYFAVWSRTGYVRRQVLGSGIYGLSADGRQRFGAFPDLIADDGYVYCQFAPEERVNPAGATFVVQAPRSLRALINRRVRIVAGNLQLAARTGLRPTVPGPSWRQVVRREPRLLPAAVVFAAINGYGAVLARRRVASGTAGVWNQDRSIRGGHSD